MKDTKEKAKIILASSEDIDEADERVIELLGDNNASPEKKISFLCETFNIEVAGSPENGVTYDAMLMSIINGKYEV